MSEKQKRIYEIIKAFINECGYSPTLREIAVLSGLNSTATIHHYLQALKNKGYIDYQTRKGRTIKVLEVNHE